MAFRQAVRHAAAAEGKKPGRGMRKSGNRFSARVPL
jgi:hypothetical protein